MHMFLDRSWWVVLAIVCLMPAPLMAQIGRRFRSVSPPPLLAQASPRPMQLTYPTSKKIDHADEYHGVKVTDPYRWLEDLDSEETKKWVEAQNKVTFGWLERVPGRERIRRRLTDLWNYERDGLPYKKGGRYFYPRNDGLQNQNAVYVVDRLEGQPRLLIDPNTLSADGTVALTNW